VFLFCFCHDRSIWSYYEP